MNHPLDFLNAPSRSMLLAAAAAVASLIAPRADAALLVYESFDYAADSLLRGQNGGTGFVADWMDDSMPDNEDSIRAGSLAYSGLSTNGNSLRMVSPWDTLGGYDIRMVDPIAGTAGSATWVSFLFALEGSSGPVRSWDWAALTFFPSYDIAYGPFFGIFDNSEGAKVIGIGSDAGTALALTDTVFVAGQTYLLVAKIAWGGEGESDTVSLFVNPPLDSEPAVPDAVTTGLTIVSNGPFVGDKGLLGVAMFAGDVEANWLFDEIRMGTTPQDVLVAVPEPTAAGLVLLGGLLVGRRRSPRKASHS